MANPEYVTDLIDDVLASQYNDLVDFARRNMLDYKLSVTVVSNDLVVALLHADGTTPSTDDPLIFKIGNDWRMISGALSITIADGTNWAAAGSPEVGGQLTGWFPYLVWDSNSSVVALTIARIPYARLVSDFSATTTNVFHAYNYANFTTTDDVINIGYFEATLSLVATSYLWTVPTFTGANLVHRPTFESRRLTFTPIFTNLTVGDGTLSASYTATNRGMTLNHLLFTFGSTSSISGSVSFTMPFVAITAAAIPKNPVVAFKDAGVGFFLGGLSIGASNQLVTYSASGTYASLVALSSTVPMTWTTTDEIEVSQCSFPIV